MRKKHIGASDAPIILGTSPWCTPHKLWERKLGIAEEVEETPAMRRGSIMEPEARKAFELATNLEVFPQIIYHTEHKFMMSSLDGLTLDGSAAVEIKCPGKKAHSMALKGKVPEYYIPQLQHQLSCLGIEKIYYYSYDGNDGVVLEIDRDDEFIEDLIEKEKVFWNCIESKTPPVDFQCIKA
jgi:putative phage-type endonuclease